MKTMLTIALLACGCAAGAQPPEAIPLWPHGAPGESPLPQAEADTSGPSGALVAGRSVIRLGNVSTPTLSVYSPPAGKNTGAAVLVFPGGGYSILALDLEGSEICEWLNTIGVTGVLVKYRVPAQQNSARKGAPLEDAQRAISMVRHDAAKWHIDPARIGIVGFSAGGHLAANLSTHFEKRSYEAVDDADTVSLRPDFAMLVYPAYLVGRDGALAPELTVTASTPPAFLIQAENDGVGVENSLGYFAALRKNRVPAEMHIYAEGGHGYGLRPTDLPITGWPALAEKWLRHIGMLGQGPAAGEGKSPAPLRSRLRIGFRAATVRDRKGAVGVVIS
jgi:acetyl esterase/lipase